MDPWTFLLRSVVALALGSLIGLERQWHRRLIDLKTNALVCLGACLFMSTTYSGDGGTDPIRVAAQIVVGVGFIGGGLLFREGTHTRGINTAATLWCSAAIGTLCGMGRLLEATLATLLLVAANTALRRVAHRLQLRMGINDNLTEQLSFEITCRTEQSDALRADLIQELLRQGGEIRGVSVAPSASGQVLISAVAAFESANIQQEIEAVAEFARRQGAGSCSWRRL